MALVLGDAGVVGPAGDLAEAGGDAAGAVLALVAVDQHRVVAFVEHEPEDARHGGGRGGDGGVLVGEHGDVVVLDAGQGHEGGVGGGRRVRGEGDDGLEAVGFEGGEVRHLRVRAAVDARPDRVEVGRQAGPVWGRRLRFVFLHGQGHGAEDGGGVVDGILVGAGLV